MESKRRTWAKALTWQLLGLLVSLIVGYFFTGNWGSACGLSLALAGAGLITYALHERLWQRIQWGLHRL